MYDREIKVEAKRSAHDIMFTDGMCSVGGFVDNAQGYCQYISIHGL